MSGPRSGAVADRFRYFLEAVGLDREAFVAAVDGAITPRSLYAVLSGARRPSRSLAVLIERTWGFRAEFLLEGSGAMWTAPPAAAASALSAQEQEVVEFMRRSVENARTVEEEVARARLWERLFERTLRLVGELERCGLSGDPADALTYPLFAKLAFDDSLFLAERFFQLGELRHRRRVHGLTSAFIRRFIEQIPRRLLTAGEYAQLRDRLAPVQHRRQQAGADLDEAIAELTAALERIAGLPLPHTELIARSEHRRALEHREALKALREHLKGPAALAALRQAERTAPDLPSFWNRFRELVEELVHAFEAPGASTWSRTAEELQALHRRVIEPLAG